MSELNRVDIVEYVKDKALVQDYCITQNLDLLLVYPRIAQQIFDAAYDVQNILNVLQSKNLDLVGRIVDVERHEVVVPLSVRKIGTKSAVCGNKRANCYQPIYGSSTELSDHIFRMMIASKILTNNTDCTIDDVKDVLSAFISSSGVIVEDNQDMTMRLVFVGELSPAERYIIDAYDVIPRPQGVKFIGYEETAIKLRLGKSFAVVGNRKAHL